jgi:hypothetical protein
MHLLRLMLLQEQPRTQHFLLHVLLLPLLARHLPVPLSIFNAQGISPNQSHMFGSFVS